ncbi:MAG: hypothetical protein DWQ47_14370 [Acidobacteria bacterium]|nr:MAG: hypothetical protein DWQ32_01770 [Acidobacteriota bacterium]REK02746.1 MAG: hypothetical protein DWQ38_10365 [Acidobacteriota bacterium]REK13449.1 MAG: hypothetical protein DWQ43_07460 [Acidobacteriota bacterium]REK41443.1 MAG: hypothetical protein DWQ47_14370 [Acidobacteriota bacterium]
MRSFFTTKTLIIAGLAALVALGAGCPANTNVNVNANADNTNSNINSNEGESNSDTNSTSSMIEANEPDEYEGVVTIGIQTSGETTQKMPTLQAKVARDGENRRMELSMPNGEKLIYLTVGADQYVIAPARKQFAKLDEQALGFEVRKLLMPDQIVSQVKALEGVKRAGEEKFNGRDVVRYTFESEAETNSSAGEVETASFVLVDKETNLPLRSVIEMESKGGNVGGVSKIMTVTEIKDLKTEVDDAMFKKPEGYDEVTPEEVRAQVQTFLVAAQAIVGQLMQSAQNPTPTPSGNSNTDR